MDDRSEAKLIILLISDCKNKSIILEVWKTIKVAYHCFYQYKIYVRPVITFTFTLHLHWLPLCNVTWILNTCRTAAGVRPQSDTDAVDAGGVVVEGAIMDYADIVDAPPALWWCVNWRARLLQVYRLLDYRFQGQCEA